MLRTNIYVPKFCVIGRFSCEKMASFFVSQPFGSHPITRSNTISSSSQTPNPQPSNLPQQPKIPPPTDQKLSASSAEPISPPAPAEQKPYKAATRSTNADSTDWIASSLTRRFGIGAGLAWVGFLAVGVVSEQIKTRLEVSRQEANTRYA